MANICENSLEIAGAKEEIADFMENVFEVEQGGIEYRISDSDEILPFGWLQNRDENSIVFDSKWEAPIDNIIEMSILDPRLTFTLTYVIPNDETTGIVEIKNAEFIRDEEDDYTSDLAREILGDDYVNDLLDQDVCKNFLELAGEEEEITNFMVKVFEIEGDKIEYRVGNDKEGETLYFGRLQSRDVNAIAFDCEYEAPIDNIVEMSKLHSTLTFTLSYAIPSEELVAVVEMKNAKIISEEEDDIYSDLARDILGDDYVDEL